MSLNKVLFIGAGGGTDVFSTVLAIDDLRRAGISWGRCSVAGLLSPFHSHEGFEEVIPGFYRTGRGATATPHRRIANQAPLPDGAVARMIEGEPALGIEAAYAFDLQEGSLGISRTLRELFLRGDFDFVVIVDLGGDILGASDRTAMSPMFEAILLRGVVDARVPAWVYVAGLGADGEGDPRDLERAVD
jgi:hypothetical protein